MHMYVHIYARTYGLLPSLSAATQPSGRLTGSRAQGTHQAGPVRLRAGHKDVALCRRLLQGRRPHLPRPIAPRIQLRVGVHKRLEQIHQAEFTMWTKFTVVKKIR